MHDRHTIFSAVSQRLTFYAVRPAPIPGQARGQGVHLPVSPRIPLSLLCVALALTVISLPALAWSNHSLLTWVALADMPEMNSARVKVERLEDFLAAEAANLERVLAEEEAWAQANVPEYPRRPDALAWTATIATGQARARFLAALRINPATPLPLFAQVPPGEKPGPREISYRQVTTLTGSTSTRDAVFRKLLPGENVAIQDVIASATDEPDYGMDIGLWEDNHTDYGKTYGFGKQPFGNPALDFATQAPFHMGFYHEQPITYAAGGFLKRTYPEYRIHLYQTLAVHALKTGHAYWGWRFAGWALHYVGDLTQPYHSAVLPGVGLPSMLWINAVAMIGFPQLKNQAITLVSNRHLSIEHYQYYRVREALLQKRLDDPLLQRLREVSADKEHPIYTDRSTREIVSRQAHTAAAQLDSTLETGFPEKFTRDPGFELGAAQEEVNMWTVAQQSPEAAQKALEQVSSALLGHFGTHTRAFIRQFGAI